MTTLHLLFKHEMIALDPNGFNSDSSSATVVLKMVCEGLTRFDHSGALAPGLALDWEASADLKRFTFRLDPAAEFQSGRPCDAEAVRACFARFLHPATNSLLAADYAGLERIDVPARHRLRFTFARPMPSFLPNLAWRTHIVDDTQRQPVGTGPFRLAWWRRGEGIGLERAAADRTAAPGNIAAAEIRFAPSGADRLAIMAAGRADIAESLPGALARRLAAPDRLVVRHAPARHKTTLCFNMRRAVLDDVRLRRAFAHAVDRERLAATFGGEGSRVVDGLLGDLADGAGEAPIAYDPDRARHLLAAAGHGGGLALRAAATAVAPVPDLAAAVADDLAAVGIVLATTLYDDPPWWPYVYLHGPWDIAFQASPARPDPDTLFSRELRTGGPFNAGGYSHAGLDALLDAARHEVDSPRRRALYAAADRHVREELPVVVLFSSAVTMGWRPAVAGFAPHPMGVIDIAEARLMAAGEARRP